MGESMGEVIEWGAPRPPSTPRWLSGVVVVALLAVVLTAGSYLAWSYVTGGAGQPARMAPATTFAFAEVDLSPSDAQQQAIRTFADHFPHSPTRGGTGALRDQLLRGMLADSTDPHVDYDRDVKPWLGDHAAVAAYVDSHGKPAVEGLLAYTNEKAAHDRLAHLASQPGVHLGFRLVDGYAVLGASQQQVDDAVTQLDKGRFADTSSYADDVAKLGADEVVTGWVDVKKAFDQLKAYLRGNLAQLGGIDPFAGITPELPKRIVAGAHAAGDYVQLDARTIGAPSLPAPGGGEELARQLPATTLVAVELRDAGQQVQRGFDQLKNSLPFDAALGAVQRQTGLTLPQDLVDLLGDDAVVSFDGMSAAGPRIGLTVHSSDPTAAQRAADKVVSLLRNKAHLPVRVDLQPTTDGYVLAVGTGYAARLAAPSGQRLGEKAGYRLVVGGAATPLSLAYVDIGGLLAQFAADAPADASVLDAAGFVAHRDGADQVLRARLSVRSKQPAGG